MIYPPRCVACGGMVSQEGGLCPDCFAETPFITGLICDLCGTPLPGQSDDAVHCDDCLKIARPWTQGRAALRYDGVGRNLVLALKHGDRHDIAPVAAGFLMRPVQELVTHDTIIAPVPLHLFRLVKRRFNQSALISQALSSRLGLTSCADLLKRRKRTQSLDGKSRDERFAELSGAISLNPKHTSLIKGRRVLLVDDVMTSGATLAACATACLDEGASEICVAAMARVAKSP